MIEIDLDVILAMRKMTSLELSEKIGITPANLSILRTGKAKAIRFSTLDAICKELNCQPGDIIKYSKDTTEDTRQQARLCKRPHHNCGERRLALCR